MILPSLVVVSTIISGAIRYGEKVSRLLLIVSESQFLKVTLTASTGSSAPRYKRRVLSYRLGGFIPNTVGEGPTVDLSAVLRTPYSVSTTSQY